MKTRYFPKARSPAPPLRLLACAYRFEPEPRDDSRRSATIGTKNDPCIEALAAGARSVFWMALRPSDSVRQSDNSVPAQSEVLASYKRRLLGRSDLVSG